MKILTVEGAALKEQFKLALDELGGCSCHLCATCSVCTHPGNPANLAESKDLWEEGKVHTSWAYAADADLRAEHNNRYFEQLMHLRAAEHMKFSTSSKYAHTTFSGELLSEEAQALTNQEILLLMDHGNLCFGGSCSKVGNKFSGRFNTD